MCFFQSSNIFVKLRFPILVSVVFTGCCLFMLNLLSQTVYDGIAANTKFSLLHLLHIHETYADVF